MSPAYLPLVFSSSPSALFPVRVRVRVRVRKRLGGDVILWKAIITTQRYFGSVRVRVRVRVRKLLGGDVILWKAAITTQRNLYGYTVRVHNDAYAYTARVCVPSTRIHSSLILFFYIRSGI